MTVTTAPATTSWKATLLAAAIGAAGGLVINTLLALAGRNLFDVPAEFQQLDLATYGPLTVIGALIGAIGWHLIATRSRNATRLLLRLVPAVLVLSLIPDVLLWISGSAPGTTAAGVITLMLMHFGVAAAAIPAYRRFIPPQS